MFVDEPLFPADSEAEATQPQEHLSIEEFNNREANRRKNMILGFGFRSLIWILVFAVFLIITDLVAQEKGLETTLIQKCLTLIEYVVTAALGFIFGRSQNND